MNLHIILILLLVEHGNYLAIGITQECFCNQMYTKNDCLRKEQCVWDKIQQMCISDNETEGDEQSKSPSSPNTPTQTPIESILPSFCSEISSNEICVSTNGCEWENNKCSFFTACTAFTSNCQQISNQCVFDGTKCIEKTTCSNYKTAKACKLNKNGKLCYWNDVCQDVNACDKLPKYLITDTQCREQLFKCTANVDGGCIESGVECFDQTSEISCVTNKDRSQPCFWKEDKCVDKTCENAPLLFTDKTCRDYLNTCTTQEGGGCVTRQQCADVKIEEACVTDIQGNKCFWDGENCNIRVCENASQDLQTNQSCDDFLTNCITNGQGCVENTGCEAAIVEQACDLTSGECHWDGTYCKKKNCENAGPNYVGYEACNNFVPNCTAKISSTSGCMSIQCLSAPLINNTNQLCEQYLPAHNCITKMGGGCRVNTICEEIDIEIACVKNINNEICFWYQGKCKTKTCTNAPNEYNSRQQCANFLQECTIGNNYKCAERLCENIITEDECAFDIFKNPCAVHRSCQNKQCSFAPKSITTHNDCQQYLFKCTVDNSGSGCMEIPQSCSMITNPNGCVINYNQNKCGWNGNNCVDYICTTAPNSFNSTSQCQQYKNGCVVNNTLNGCMDLPILCSNRFKQDNCEIESGSASKCQWNTEESSCINIDCTNAHKISLKGNVTQSGCWNYYSLNCIINKDGTQCMSRPQNCDGLAQNACLQQNVLVNNSNCFWDSGSSTCKIIACSSITLTSDYTHEKCFQQINTCTVNSSGNKCINLSTCDQYIFQPQCVIDQNYFECQWNGNSCGNKNCADAADDSTNINDTACQLFSKKCTVTSKKCSIKLSSCSSNINQYSCELNTLSNQIQCAWINDQCQETAFNCYDVKGIGLTSGYCNFLNSNCSVNSLGTYCIQVQDKCSNYLEQDCRWATSDGYCQWGGQSCQVDCSKAQGPYFDIDYCSSYNGQCTSKRDASSCVLMEMNCQDTLPENCTKALKGFCYLIQGTSTCVDGLTTPITDCGSISGTRLPILYCQLISSMICTVNSYFNSCIKKEIYCGSYTEGSQCVDAWIGKCVFSNGGCSQIGFSLTMCESIQIDGLSQYTDFHCNQIFKDICVANSSQTGCKMKDFNQNAQIQCNSYTGDNLSYYDCVNKSSSCSVNAAKTNCVYAKATCAEYFDLSECSYATQDGDCQVYDNLCIQKQCDNAPQTVIDNAQCQTYSHNCISHIGGCQIRKNCSSYLFKVACIKSLDGFDCLWNPSTGKCVTKECGNAESSSYFNDDTKCSTVGNCTVKANQDYTIGQGCIPRNSCNSYTIQEQCKFNDQGVACIWNTNNPDSPICSDKSCSTASLIINTHSDCQQYLNICTVNIINSVPSGCTELKPCNQYVDYDQCKISINLDLNNNPIICDWNGTICGNKGCLTANNSYNTPTKCQQYFEGCTVNSTNDGCINIPKICEGMTQQQCYNGSFDASNRKCWWKNSQCITKTCSNSPNQQNESDCESHLSTCTLNFSSCYSLFCSDFSLSTESECLTAVPSGLCTSNGNICIPKNDCSDTHIQQECTKDSQGRKCEWVINDDGSSQCNLQSCLTAPKALKSEAECLQYYTPTDGSICTTKQNGGCIVKGDCTTLTIQSICTTDNVGKECVWDNDTKLCRYSNCKDIFGTSYTQCNSINNKCTVGLKGKCATLQRCEDTKIKEACIKGTNGSCLWIAGYKNQDSSLGTCFLYSSCQSLNWTTDSQCKLISPYCTTDGKRCVGITTCSESSVEGGCLKGTDGLCVITPKTKESKDLICKKFTYCNDIYYLTHNDCLKAHSNCTSDYLNGCIPLTECSKYIFEGQCQINSIGILKDKDGKLISTGKCIWDNNNNKCRDQICTDIQLTTEQDCSSQFYNCTSDGQNCIIKQQCTSYLTQNLCEVAGGIDGPCFWVEATESTVSFCRKKVCNDIKNPNNAIQCSEVPDCIFDGTYCIDQAQCSSYTTMPACQSTGRDGVCIWIDGTNSGNGKCQRMTSCQDSKDQVSCTQAKNRCNWLTSKKQCSNHTCETFQLQENSCTYFLSFDQQKYTICTLKDNKCVETDPASLNEENCYKMSGRLYSWNPIFEKCAQCERVLQNDIFDQNGKDFLSSSLIIRILFGCWLFIFKI